MMSSAVRRAPSDWYLGIDRGLPQLAAAFDLPAVSRLYEERWPGRAEAGLRVSARKVHDVEYQPSARCVVTHELTLKRGGGEPVETIGAIDVRPAGLGLRAFHEDPDLPWLADAADPVKVGRHLWALELAPGCRIVRVIPLRYKPGSQCLLRFDLEAGSVPRALYGKVLAIDGYRLARTLSALRAQGGGRTRAGPRLRRGDQTARVCDARGATGGPEPRLLPERPAADRGRRALDDRPGRALLGEPGSRRR